MNDALRTALAADERVVLLGQDIAAFGGVFKATEGLLDAFGDRAGAQHPDHRVGAIGAALGLALDGFRPVVEMQFADFVSCGFNQLVNNVATTRYRWGAPVPLVVRLPVGGGLGAGPFHSQNVEAWFCHVSGLKVVAPATAADAKGCCWRPWTTATRSWCWSTRSSTAAPAGRCRPATTSSRSDGPASPGPGPRPRS